MLLFGSEIHNKHCALSPVTHLKLYTVLLHTYSKYIICTGLFTPFFQISSTRSGNIFTPFSIFRVQAHGKFSPLIFTFRVHAHEINPFSLISRTLHVREHSVEKTPFFAKFGTIMRTHRQ